MSTRDADYETLLGELSEPLPHLEKPDEVAQQEGSICWLNPARMCGGDCVAHNPGASEGSPDRCTVLAVLGSLADSRDEMAQSVVKTATLARVAAADAVRAVAAAAPVPNPFGGRS